MAGGGGGGGGGKEIEEVGEREREGGREVNADHLTIKVTRVHIGPQFICACALATFSGFPPRTSGAGNEATLA